MIMYYQPEGKNGEPKLELIGTSQQDIERRHLEISQTAIDAYLRTPRHDSRLFEGAKAVLKASPTDLPVNATLNALDQCEIQVINSDGMCLKLDPTQGPAFVRLNEYHTLDLAFKAIERTDIYETLGWQAEIPFRNGKPRPENEAISSTVANEHISFGSLDKNGVFQPDFTLLDPDCHPIRIQIEADPEAQAAAIGRLVEALQRQEESKSLTSL